MVAMQRDGARHRVGLALQAVVVDAGAAADPILRLAAPERVIDGGGDRRIADAHFAEHSRSAPEASASMPNAIVAAQAFSSSAGSRVMSPVGFSSASSNTLSEMSKVLQIWLIAAPPSRNWRPSPASPTAETATRLARRRRDCRRRPRPAADRHAAAPSPARRPAIRRSPRAGRASRRAWSVAASRARTAARAASSAFGILPTRSRMSSKGRVAVTMVSRRMEPL